LEERFENPQIIVSSHVDALLKLEPVSNIHEIVRIRKLYDSIETHIRSLANLNIESETYGTLLIPMIVAKLPEEMQLLISRKVGKDGWKLDELLKEFRIELEAREKCSLLQSTTEKKDGARRKYEPSTSSALFTGSDNRSIQKCMYCGEQHLSSRCNIITDISARRAILRKKGRCFACLKSGRIVIHCPSKFKCQKCGNNHHISLCEGIKPREDPTKPNQNQKQQPLFQAKGNEASTNVCANTNVSVLLQIAKAMVRNPNVPQKQKLQSRIVFDSCSQRSYIKSAEEFIGCPTPYSYVATQVSHSSLIIFLLSYVLLRMPIRSTMKGDSFSSAHTWGKCSFVTEIIQHVEYSVPLPFVIMLINIC
jgi:hypothetical protein